MKKPFFFVSAIFAFILLSGCAKEMIPGLVQGKYTVSGVMYFWSLGGVDSLGNTTMINDTTYYNNVTVEIDKVDYETISVYFSGSSSAPRNAVYNEDESSGSEHIFTNESGGEKFAFKKKNLRKLNIDMNHRIGNSRSEHYIYSGSKN